MMPVCSATPCCSSHPQIFFHGGLRPFCPFRNDSQSRCIVEDRVVLGFQDGIHLQRISFKTQAAKSLYYNFIERDEQSVPMNFTGNPSCGDGSGDIKCNLYDDWGSSVGTINELDQGGEKVEYVESYSISDVEEGLMDLTSQPTESTDSLTRPMESDIISNIIITPENPIPGTDSMGVDNDSLPSVKINFDDFIGGIGDSFSTSVNKGQNAVNNSLDTVTSSITSIVKSASEAVDNALSGIFSAADQTRGLAGNRLTSFSSDLKEVMKKATVISVDVLRDIIIAAEDSIMKGASFVVYSYGSTKELLPPEIRVALNLSEDKAGQILRPIVTSFQQVYIAIEGLEKNLGLDPNDPIVPFFLFIGTSTALWVLYRVWTYGGYSGDLSPQLTLELLAGREKAVLIDVRPEVLRERDGIPDLRRAARFRYASVTLPEVDEQLRKLLKGGRDVDNSLIAAVIRNLKVVQDRSKVIVMDADGTSSKGIARALRKLGVKRPYLVQGGFQSWVKQGLRFKELKPETALTLLNEEAEAILEDLSPSPLQVLGFGVGSVAVFYALLEWEKTLQLIAVVGLAQSIYRRVASYDGPEDFREDVRRLLAPVRLGAQAFSWAAGKLETNGLRLPTSPSSVDVQSRVLQAAAKHESQPSDTEGVQNPSTSESVAQ
ncbi:uncharacterized protein LOC105636682 isoform X2 [Jatropha curcas]|uniref:uncharacterized protein LOC105636682 isoform X2 n=1 Tax=Jatropha curcas TaxID=180498 RepID=UPI0005FAB891|nr:uncharacterized protein LOC105636682 isoform X2 [Jatropha curcas]XP_020535982.1 uncharacterized protein LOC105636682 isoform X2 [Jatropha curcas]XP_037493824.1 uncharacterized protein LOC105636682 isoform X2 [Jatropha curcas]XP_037493825.1 uncharacterized protein LOC105636682 isoform X2 [Jatropha curcas]